MFSFCKLCPPSLLTRSPFPLCCTQGPWCPDGRLPAPFTEDKPSRFLPTGTKSPPRSPPGPSQACRGRRTGASSGATSCPSPASSRRECPQWHCGSRVPAPLPVGLQLHPAPAEPPPWPVVTAICTKPLLLLLLMPQGAEGPAHTHPGQYPGGGSGEVLGVRSVFCRNQRHSAQDRGRRLLPAAGFLASHLHPPLQHVRSPRERPAEFGN